jgi:hypothetical protein
MKLVFCVVMTMALLMVLVAMSAKRSKEFPKWLPPVTSIEETSITGCMVNNELTFGPSQNSKNF